MSPQEQIKSNILELQNALLNAHPSMPTLLRTIHSQLKQNPDCVTLLEAEEIGIIVTGLKRQTGIEITTKSSTVSKAKRISSVSLDDLGL